MIRTILESPYAGDIEKNLEYARACVRESLERGEAPIASHLLYTQPGILKDEVYAERQWGIDAGLAWLSRADKHVFYLDRGISRGMQYAISKDSLVPKEFRLLGLRIYKLADSDFYAAKSYEEAVQYAMESSGLTREEVLDLGDAEEDPADCLLSYEAMDKATYHDEDDRVERSFSEELSKLVFQQISFPCFFATENY